MSFALAVSQEILSSTSVKRRGTTLWFDPDVLTQIERCAEALGCTRSALVNATMKRFFADLGQSDVEGAASGALPVPAAPAETLSLSAAPGSAG